MKIKKVTLIIAIAVSLNMVGSSFALAADVESSNKGEIISQLELVNPEVNKDEPNTSLSASDESNVNWTHSAWREYKNDPNWGSLQRVCCSTSAYYKHNNQAVYHYSRAQLGVWLITFDVRLDSERQWGTGTSSAQSPYGILDLSARTFYGY